MRNPNWLFVLLLCAALLCGGCATPAVWGVKDCSPAENPNLSLAFNPKNEDILVRYEQQTLSAWNNPTETKYYWLFSYSDNPPKGRRPEFIDNTNLPDLVRIPVGTDGMTPLPESSYSAQLNLDQKTFDLYRNGVDLGRFSLPFYSTPSKPANAARVLLTPPAAIVDTVMMSAVLAAFGARGY